MGEETVQVKALLERPVGEHGWIGGPGEDAGV